MSEMIGRIFDRKYRVTRLIGEGGMATVFEAEHTTLQRQVAVKVMHRDVADMPSATDRFFREAVSASAIGHPNIIEIFHVGQEEDGTVYMVEELLKGKSLKQVMQKEGKIKPKTAVMIVLQVLSGLKAAHDKGIVHRDIKPDNIFLATDRRKKTEVKLLDFGVAKVQESAAAKVDQALTQLGTVLGTPKYMSPEQARGVDIDGRTDIWSVGVVLYEMLAARPPYEGENYNVLLSSILMDEPTPLGELMPNLSYALIRVVQKAMAKDLEERYQKASEMIEHLLPFAKGVEDLMSTTTVRALRSSIAPSPAPTTPVQHAGPPNPASAQNKKNEFAPVKLKSFPPPRPGAQDPMVMSVAAPVHSANEQSFPMHAPSGQSLELQPVSDLDFGQRFRPSGRQRFMGAPAVRRTIHRVGKKKTIETKWVVRLVVLIGAIAVLAYFSSGGDTAEGEDSIPATEEAIGFWDRVFSDDVVDPGPGGDGANVRFRPKKAGTGEAASEGPGAGAEDGVESDTAAQPSEQDMVTIQVKGIPPFAEVYLDAKRVRLPIVMPKSSDTLRMDVIAAGFIPLNKNVVPDRDQTLDLKMKKISTKTELKRE